MRMRTGHGPDDWTPNVPVDTRDWSATVDDVPVCVNGHPLTGAAYSNGYARCRVCHAESERRRRAARG